MDPRKLCQEAWQEIASHFPDFKVLSKGQKLKRHSKLPKTVSTKCRKYRSKHKAG